MATITVDAVSQILILPPTDINSIWGRGVSLHISGTTRGSKSGVFHAMLFPVTSMQGNPIRTRRLGVLQLHSSHILIVAISRHIFSTIHLCWIQRSAATLQGPPTRALAVQGLVKKLLRMPQTFNVSLIFSTKAEDLIFAVAKWKINYIAIYDN